MATLYFTQQTKLFRRLDAPQGIHYPHLATSTYLQNFKNNVNVTLYSNTLD